MHEPKTGVPRPWGCSVYSLRGGAAPLGKWASGQPPPDARLGDWARLAPGCLCASALLWALGNTPHVLGMNVPPQNHTALVLISLVSLGERLQGSGPCSEDRLLRSTAGQRAPPTPMLLSTLSAEQLLPLALPCSTPARNLSFLPKAQAVFQEKVTSCLPATRVEGRLTPPWEPFPGPVHPQLCPAQVQTGRQAEDPATESQRGSQSRRTSVRTEPSHGDWPRQVGAASSSFIRV